MAQPVPELMEILRVRYGLEVRSATALVGGYDVWAESWRVDTDRGPWVLRVDRSMPPQTANWLGEVVAGAASAGVPCQPPTAALDETAAVPFGGATVTVRPFVDGVNLNRDDPSQVAAAGAMLGRLHRALRGERSDRPTLSPWAACSWPGDRDPPDLHDPALDAWNEGILSGARGTYSRGVVHGDYWADNLVWNGDGIAAVIDWSEARVDMLARELAWATWEFGHDEDSSLLDEDRARSFLHGYRDAAGAWEPGLEEVFVPLMRVEVRLNARYSLTDPEDMEYNAGLRQGFARLRSQSATRLLDR